MKAVSLKEANRLDNISIYKIGIPRIVLMENAGRAVAELIGLNFKKKPHVAAISGGGYNGGDAMVAVRHLTLSGFKVESFISGGIEKAKDETVMQARILQGLGIRVKEIVSDKDIKILERGIKRSDLIIDGLLGAGLKGEVREPNRTIIGLINNSGKNVVSVDIPSGLDGDTARVCGVCVKADHTVTFQAVKKGMLKPPGRYYSGRVTVADIGI
ncbi:MAG: NAD(P)H-hydrate epimerase [Candidatus Omnitrophica bacterium]|nr:NAD(P)H-hydrate epimerase [Candidatus Omnitrophota bacterium]